MQGSYRDIIKLAAPIYLGMLSNNIVGLVDTFFLGRVGLPEQSAAGYGTLFYMVLYVIGYGFCLGPQILIARRTGEQRWRTTGRIFQHSLSFLFIYGFVLTIGTFLFIFPLMESFTQSSSIGKLTGEYLYYRGFGLLGTMMNLAFMSYYIGIGRSFVITLSSVISGLTNLLLDWALIFGNWGFPEMGIEGAALASSAAEWTGTLVYVVYTWFYKANKKNGIFQFRGWHKTQFTEIFRLSFPLMLQNCVAMGAWFIFFTIIEKTGEINFGISIILRSIYSLFLISAISIGSATNSIVSNIIGQNREKEIFSVLGRIIRVSLGFMLVNCIFLWITRADLFLLFTDNPLLVLQSEESFLVIVIALLFFSVSTVFFNAVSGTGLIKITLLIECSCIFFYLIYTYYVSIPLQLSLGWIWSSEILYPVSLGIASAFYLINRKRKAVKI